jgi:hypothetical protein
VSQRSASDAVKPPGLQFLGHAIVPTGTGFTGTTVGGLSSIVYDPHGQLYTCLFAVRGDDLCALVPRRRLGRGNSGSDWSPRRTPASPGREATPSEVAGSSPVPSFATRSPASPGGTMTISTRSAF